MRSMDQIALSKFLFENNPQPMWIYDIYTLCFLEVNNAAIAKYGYSRDEFSKMNIKDIRPHEDVNSLIEDIQQSSDEINISTLMYPPLYCTEKAIQGPRKIYLMVVFLVFTPFISNQTVKDSSPITPGISTTSSNTCCTLL